MCFKIDGDSVPDALLGALENMDSAGGEMALDFSAVSRIDSSALRALEKLAGVADNKAVKVTLRGVNINIYKALKLAKLVPRFSFPV